MKYLAEKLGDGYHPDVAMQETPADINRRARELKQARTGESCYAWYCCNIDGHTVISPFGT